MKTMGTILKIGILLAVLAALAGCFMTASRSKDECINEFLNNAERGNWTSMYKQIHPDNPNYNSYKSGSTFSTIFNSSVSYSVTLKLGNTYTVSGSDFTTYVFTFEREDEDMFSEGFWSIRSFTFGGSTY